MSLLDYKDLCEHDKKIVDYWKELLKTLPPLKLSPKEKQKFLEAKFIEKYTRKSTFKLP